MALVTGILVVLLGIVHIIYGEYVQIPGLARQLDDPGIIGSTRVMIYQGGMILLAVGIVQLLKGARRIRLRGAAAFFPIGIMIMNILTFLIVALVSGRSLIAATLPQLVVFLVIIVLMAIEVRNAPGEGGRK
jgi:hypothetical protein